MISRKPGPALITVAFIGATPWTERLQGHASPGLHTQVEQEGIGEQTVVTQKRKGRRAAEKATEPDANAVVRISTAKQNAVCQVTVSVCDARKLQGHDASCERLWRPAQVRALQCIAQHEVAVARINGTPASNTEGPVRVGQAQHCEGCEPATLKSELQCSPML